MNLSDPLRLAQVIADLADECESKGYPVELSTDFERFYELRKEVRGENVSPMFDPNIDLALSEHAFWMASLKEDGTVQCLQAFRVDTVDTSLANWVGGWMAGQYLKRSELVVFEQSHPPENSMTWNVNGQVVYHGELWIHPKLNNNGCVDLFPRLGMLLCHMKWQPASIWALVGKPMATRGFMVRLGYAQVERSFLKWSIEPKGADAVEWIALANRNHLDFLTAEIKDQMIDMSTSAMAVTTDTPLRRSGNLCGNTTL